MKNFQKKIIHDFEEKEKKMELDDLPKVLVVHLCLNFFDLDSILNFSSTNKNFNSYFSEFRKAHFYFKFNFLRIIFLIGKKIHQKQKKKKKNFSKNF
jgi:hypothetical protein